MFCVQNYRLESGFPAEGLFCWRIQRKVGFSCHVYRFLVTVALSLSFPDLSSSRDTNQGLCGAALSHSVSGGIS